MYGAICPIVVSADKPEPDEKTEKQILTCQQ